MIFILIIFRIRVDGKNEMNIIKMNGLIGNIDIIKNDL